MSPGPVISLSLLLLAQEPRPGLPGDPAQALAPLEQALAVQRQHLQQALRFASEGEALAQLAALPRTRDVLLSVLLRAPGSEGRAYAAVWADRCLWTRL